MFIVQRKQNVSSLKLRYFGETTKNLKLRRKNLYSIIMKLGLKMFTKLEIYSGNKKFAFRNIFK